MHLCECFCLAAREAGGWDSDREGQMETNTTVCHGCRKAGNPSSPAPFLSLSPLFPFLTLSSSTLSLLSLPSLFLFCRLQSVCSSLPVPSSGFYSLSYSGTLFLHISLLVFYVNMGKWWSQQQTKSLEFSQGSCAHISVCGIYMFLFYL